MIYVYYLSLLILNQDHKHVRTELGQSGKSTLSFKINYDELALHDQCDIAIEFSNNAGKHLLNSNVFKIGRTFRSLMSVRCGPYLGNGRKQIFISIQFGSSLTYVLDYDGQNVFICYAENEGRTQTDIKKDNKGYYLNEVVKIEGHLENGRRVPAKHETRKAYLGGLKRKSSRFSKY